MTRVSPTVAPSVLPTQAVGFARNLAQYGDRTALIQDDSTTGTPTSLIYHELAAAVAAEASSLTADDPGTRRLVLIALDRSVDAVTTYLAILAGGHVALLAPDHDTEAQRKLIATYDPDVVARRVDDIWTVASTRPSSETIFNLCPMVVSDLLVSSSKPSRSTEIESGNHWL